jgi:SAM-dependent methyltransferase
MPEMNLLDKYPKSKRPIEERGKRRLAGGDWLDPTFGNKDSVEIMLEYKMLEIARQFGKEYFDGDRLYGYGGYNYNPKFWTNTVKRFMNHYKLKKNAEVLDVGCAKGFMMHDFKKLMPKMRIKGLDISSYAYDSAISDMKPFIVVGNAKKLPFKDKHFDLVISINTVDHLSLEECKKAIKEIQRVTKKDAFISVNAWRTEKEKEKLLKWNVTAMTNMHVNEWKRLFREVGYKGDYFWFIPK